MKDTLLHPFPFLSKPVQTPESITGLKPNQSKLEPMFHLQLTLALLQHERT